MSAGLQRRMLCPLALAIVCAAMLGGTAGSALAQEEYYDGCSRADLINAIEGNFTKEQIREICSGTGGGAETEQTGAHCSGIGCYTKVDSHFINGGIGQGEYGHTAESCADRCNADARCLSFEMYKDDYCSINGTNRKSKSAIYSESDDYTYYEHKHRSAKE